MHLLAAEDEIQAIHVRVKPLASAVSNFPSSLVFEHWKARHLGRGLVQRSRRIE